MTDLITRLSNALRQSGKKLATAESCTGGLISARITDLSGSSSIFDRGFVTYSNEAKEDMLGVSHETLRDHGAVSEKTAIEMAQGALDNSAADIAVAVTGIAGPNSDDTEKQVGLVYIAVASNEGTECFRHNFKGERSAIREQTVQAALAHALDLF
jgi:nicotinamide-nucleotide amidase